MKMEYEEQADKLCLAIKALSEDEDKLNNLKSYLSRHFDKWIEKYANSPDGLVNEMQTFADM